MLCRDNNALLLTLTLPSLEGKVDCFQDGGRHHCNNIPPRVSFKKRLLGRLPAFFTGLFLIKFTFCFVHPRPLPHRDFRDVPWPHCSCPRPPADPLNILMSVGRRTEFRLCDPRTLWNIRDLTLTCAVSVLPKQDIKKHSTSPEVLNLFVGADIYQIHHRKKILLN